MLRIALPNGTLEERTTALFQKAGIMLERNPRCYTVFPKKLSAMVSFMRPQHVPLAVERGSYDIGITGSDWVAETSCRVTVMGKLDYSGKGDREWKIALVGAKDDPAQGVRSINLKSSILSEFPKLTEAMLKEAGISVPIVFSFGTTEAHIPHDFKYGVCIVSTEETIGANNLKIVEVLSVETAVVIGSSDRFKDSEKEQAARLLINKLTWH